MSPFNQGLIFFRVARRQNVYILVKSSYTNALQIIGADRLAYYRLFTTLLSQKPSFSVFDYQKEGCIYIRLSLYGEL